MYFVLQDIIVLVFNSSNILAFTFFFGLLFQKQNKKYKKNLNGALLIPAKLTDWSQTQFSSKAFAFSVKELKKKWTRNAVVHFPILKLDMNQTHFISSIRHRKTNFKKGGQNWKEKNTREI